MIRLEAGFHLYHPELGAEDSGGKPPVPVVHLEVQDSHYDLERESAHPDLQGRQHEPPHYPPEGEDAGRADVEEDQ